MDGDEKIKLKVFISYASEDRERVLPFWKRIKDSGHDPWMDCKNILPGKNWEHEISRAFSMAHVYVLFMSQGSVNKRGFVQREAREAIEKINYSLDDDIVVIPVLLEKCDVPTSIAEKLHYININEDGAIDLVLSSLNEAARLRKIIASEGVACGPFTVHEQYVREQLGTPSPCEIQISYPKFESDKIPEVAADLSKFFEGIANLEKIEKRKSEVFDSEAFMSEIGSDYSVSYDVYFSNDKLLSISRIAHGYSSGAAHGYSYFDVYNFTLYPYLKNFSIGDFFSYDHDALEMISKLAIEKISEEWWERGGEMPDESSLDWIKNGAAPDWDNFKSFTFNRDGISVFFQEYQVAAYALGTFSVEISFFELRGSIKVIPIYEFIREN